MIAFRPTHFLALAFIAGMCGGCQSDRIEPLPRPAEVPANMVLVRGARPPEAPAKFDIWSANGRLVERGFLMDGTYFVVVPIGWNRLSIEVEDGITSSARMRDWVVFLPGGSPLVLTGELHRNSVQVWFEEEATGKRMTDSASLALVWD